MLYIETDLDQIEEQIKVVNGRMTDGALRPDWLPDALAQVEKIAFEKVAKTNFIGSTVTIRSRSGHFPKRYKYCIKGVQATFKRTQKGWAFVSCERTEDYPDQRLPEYIINWSPKAREALEKQAKREYDQAMNQAISIKG